ncbi:MAG TPA: histidine kinase dimerization/phospho-acceptor domain-containing protein [Candidatus Xenobia bacterium]|jgi:signal transduction histidine kinase
MRTRLTLLFLAAQAILLVVVTAGLLWWSQAQAELHARNALDATAGRLVHDAEGDNLQDSLDEELVAMRQDQLSLQVWNAQGQTVLHSGPPPGADVRTLTFPLAGRRARLVFPWDATRLHHEAGLLLLVDLIFLITGGLGAWLLVGRCLAPLQETMKLRGRFYAAASHELRTPLQALSGHLELSLSRPRSPEAYEKALREAQRQTERLTALVRDLLLLTSIESQPPPPPATVDLEEVCSQVLRALQPLVDERHLHVSLDAKGSIQSPPSHIEMLVRNLVENAVRYAKEGGQVTVSAGDSLRVFNECTPTPETAGLGLAICHALARTNGWQLTLEPREQGMAAVVRFA